MGKGQELYKKAKKMIEDHKDVLYKSAELLMEKEKIYGDEFAALFDDASAKTTVSIEKTVDAE